MSQPGDRLAQARAAHRQRRWPEAHASYAAVGGPAVLAPDDSAAFADAAWWLGRVDDSIAAGSAAFTGFLAAGRAREAAMAAVGVAVNHSLRGDGAAGRGWVAHAARLLDDQPECPEHGYLAYLLQVEGALDSADRAPVLAAARRVRELGRRHGDTNLVAMGLLGEGRVLVRAGRVTDGMALLDEAMAHVLAGEVVPDWAGNVYCHLMSTCHELGDLRRARQWVEATSSWLDTLPAAVLFTGICRVHRSQVLQETGHWAESEREAARVCTDLGGIAGQAAAEGHYQLGELARLRGDRVAAERAYRQAHRLGGSPQPGLALLRLAQGRIDAARASVRTALIAETANRLVRARLLAAEAEIALAAGARDRAAAAAGELTDIAERYASPGFTAAARHWTGAVLLARDRAGAALPVLHEARRAWQELQAPYDCARVRVLLADACRRLGDADGAELELAAAAEVFARLGAAPDEAAVAALRGVPSRPGGLTDREREVLACLAAGRSNREIAGALVISEKTVARHLSNIFTKLGVGSRTAAAAWGNRHGIAG
jgi:DNA-binding CsgD family transcriptional regulator